ncbi:MAG: MBL fold metallo-hydrolase [Alphaproteobacteria bacterium]|nr:MBL fold metallo-hydrolase [Alphaproteobacteria bacterium]
MSEPEISGFFEPVTGTVSYLVVDRASRAAMIVDPVLDYDWRAGRTSTRSLEAIAKAAEGLRVEFIAETHPHADHLSGARWLKERLGGKIVIGAGIAAVQRAWAPILDLEPGFACDGSQFDMLLQDGARLSLGELDVAAMDTPGHTPACVTLVVAARSGGRKHAFVGDALFMPDYGTARTDFPGGSARTLYRSIRRILSLPEDTKLYTAHDYQPGGRAVAFVTTVGEQRRTNVHVKDGISEDSFVEMREARDAKLDAPNLLLPSINVNVRGGNLPPAAANGTRYFKIPIDRI